MQIKSTHVNVKTRCELKGGGKGQITTFVILTFQENCIFPWQVRTAQKLLLREGEERRDLLLSVVVGGGGGGGLVVVVMHTYMAASHEKANKCLWIPSGKMRTSMSYVC